MSMEAEKQEQDTLAYREAARLAEWLFKKHYAHEEHYASGRVVWGLFDTTAGVISQIDNMVCQLVRAEKQEPVIDKSAAIRIATALGWEPKREWLGLTDDEINKLRYKKDWTAPWTDTTFARAIEAKLKEKNT